MRGVREPFKVELIVFRRGSTITVRVFLRDFLPSLTDSFFGVSGSLSFELVVPTLAAELVRCDVVEEEEDGARLEGGTTGAGAVSAKFSCWALGDNGPDTTTVGATWTGLGASTSFVGTGGREADCVLVLG